METTPSCPGCRKPLAPDAPLGLCPECLIKSGFNTGTDPGAPGNANFAAPPASQIAKLFPQLEILNFIGKGGMGAVYKARQPVLDRIVALKILPPQAADDPGFVERFNREARALARLTHPNIVGIYDFGTVQNPPAAQPETRATRSPTTQPYLLMEYVDGMNLREVERAERLTPQQALQIVPQICDALQFAHSEGVVHRDIKPENILLDKKGRVKITDFGIAKTIGSISEKVGLTGAAETLGTPHYMAPEQVERPDAVDHRADIYSLGVVFYELLTGELPLGKFPPPSRKVALDVRLDDVVLRALEKEPERRYQQAGQVKTDVQTIVSTPLIHPPSPAPSILSPAVTNPRSVFRPRRSLWIAIAIALAGVFAVLTLGGIFMAFLIISAKRLPTPIPHSDHQTLPASPQSQSPSNLGKGAAPPATSRPKPEPAELSETELRDVLVDLKSPSPALQQLALSKLVAAKPRPRRDEVQSELLRLLKSADWPVRQSAAAALAIWGTEKAFDPLVATLKDPVFSVRWAAIDALASLKQPRTAAVLAEHMDNNDDILRTSQALQTLGTPAEDDVTPLLQHQNPQVRYAACHILQEIGTRKSIPALTKSAADADEIMAMLSKDALKAIDARH